MDFAIRLVKNSVLNLPDAQVKYFEGIQITELQSVLINFVVGLQSLYMLVTASGKTDFL